MNKKQFIWNEFYRPKVIDDFVGNDIIKNKFKEYIKDGNIPHLLLYGKNGTGKSTLAKIIIKNIDCDYIYINASDENNVDTVRTKIKSFASSIGFKDLKIIVLDEGDYLTPNSQAALRNLMEVNSKYTRFIITCNYHNKIIDPIISRCQSFEVKPIDKVDVAKRITYILDSENIKYDLKDVAFLINSFYPDIRKIINETQKNSNNSILEINKDKIINSDYKLKILEILKEKNTKSYLKFNTIRKIIADNSVMNFIELYKFLYDNIDQLDTDAGDAIIIIAEHEYQDSFVVDHEITFASCIAQLIKIIK